MRNDTAQMLDWLSERAERSHREGGGDLQSSLDTAFAAGLALDADDSSGCATMARVLRASALGVRSALSRLCQLEQKLRDSPGSRDLADEIGEIWGNPNLRR